MDTAPGAGVTVTNSPAPGNWKALALTLTPPVSVAVHGGTALPESTRGIPVAKRWATSAVHATGDGCPLKLCPAPGGGGGNATGGLGDVMVISGGGAVVGQVEESPETRRCNWPAVSAYG